MADISEHLIKGRRYLNQLEQLSANVNLIDKTELWKVGDALLHEVNQVMICVDRICNEHN